MQKLQLMAVLAFSVPVTALAQASPPEDSEQQRVIISPGQSAGGFSLEAIARRGISWDVTITGGLRLARSDLGDTAVWMARMRAAVMVYKEPSFLIIGPSVQLGGITSGAAFGGELEAVNSGRGLWGQIGAYGDRGGAIVGVSAGLTLFGLEYQRRLSGEEEGMYSVFLNLHIPIGLIWVSAQPLQVRATPAPAPAP